jgi:hypothetical protein
LSGATAESPESLNSAQSFLTASKVTTAQPLRVRRRRFPSELDRQQLKPQQNEQMHMKKLLTTISLGGLLALSSVGIAQQASEPADSSIRLEALLQPVIAVDASGKARLDNEVGTPNDRFTAEVEIAKADFAELGITRGNGFRDEVVELRVLRSGVLIFSNRLQFSRNLVNDITFETDLRGTAAPELQAGDVTRVIVNGHFTLRGRFQVH